MTLESYLLVAAALFSLGLIGALSHRNLIALLIGIELMMNAASLNLMAFNRFVVTDSNDRPDLRPHHHWAGSRRSRYLFIDHPAHLSGVQRY